MFGALEAPVGIPEKALGTSAGRAIRPNPRGVMRPRTPTCQHAYVDIRDIICHMLDDNNNNDNKRHD